MTPITPAEPSVDVARQDAVAPRDPGAALSVLLAEPDLFGRVGGGETVAASLARALPSAAFVNLTRTALGEALGQPNVRLVPLRAKIKGEAAFELARVASGWHRYDYDDFIQATNIAASVSGQSFDVVEVPDFTSYGRFLPFACADHGVKVGRFVHSLHGRLSRTYELEWFKVGQPLNEYDHARRRAEDLTLKSLDVRYALSAFYREELAALTDLPIHLIDPLLCIDRGSIREFPPCAPGPVQLVFISRLERRKGGDRFIELLWHLGDRAAGSHRLVIGGDTNLGGLSGRDRVERHQRHRHVENVEYVPAISPRELRARVFQQRSIVVLPTRYDTFSLTALEAVLHGCPVMLTRSCGAWGYLHEQFPGVPLLEYDPDDLPRAAERLVQAVETFDTVRARQIRAVQSGRAEADVRSILKAYTAPPAYCRDARGIAAREYEDIRRVATDLVGGVGAALAPQLETGARPTEPRELAQSEMDVLGRLAQGQARFHHLDPQSTDAEPRGSIFRVVGHLTGALEALRGCSVRSLDGLLSILAGGAAVSARGPRQVSDPERTVAAVQQLLRRSPAFLRSRLYYELGEAEAARGRVLVRTAYDVRLIRWLGGDRWGVLSRAVTAMNDAGLSEEARAAALYTDALGGAPGEAVRTYLADRAHQLRRLAVPADYETIVDRRTRDEYHVSVVVSLYDVSRAALARFVRDLTASALVRDRHAEIVFVDSGSPHPVEATLAEVLANKPCDFVLARTARRETIQSAWNRGITLSRSRYLSFLGVDEALHPEALAVLAAALDANPTVDWVMGDSVVTAVDEDGGHIDDKMAYVRSGNWTEAALLFDCTYLSYVGGMYRRTLHDRCGYYDPSFRGAGDTEFKCRVHPGLTTLHLPRTLGTFLDYPSARTTNSCRIELEDLRAWYVFRTSGGIDYLTEGAGPERLDELFWGALANRRAFTTGPECDVAFALSVLSVIRGRTPNAPVLRFEPVVRELLETIRSVGTWSDWSVEGYRTLRWRLRRAEAILHELARQQPAREFPREITRDAQFFAHAWFWE